MAAGKQADVRTGILVGLAMFVVFAVYQAPAGMLRPLLDEEADITLIDLRGTLWQGRASLIASGAELGELHWSLRPTTLFRGALGYVLQLTGSDLQVQGLLEAGLAGTRLELSGNMGAAELNRHLAAYDIAIDGRFELDQAMVAIADGRPSAADGTVRWTGGGVRYVLSGRASSSMLPPLTAFLGPGPEAVVFPADGQTPLLTAHLLENGFAKVGVTKYLTKMLGSPWPGGDPDHAVVLEVEEQVF